MSVKHLVLAIALSLSFHAALLTVLEVWAPGVDEHPESAVPTLLIASVSLTPPGSPAPPLPEEASTAPVERTQETDKIEDLLPVAMENQSESDTSSVHELAESPKGIVHEEHISEGVGEAGEASSLYDAPELGESEPVLLTVIEPVYPLQARRLGLEGIVILEVKVDSDGAPLECRILRPRSHRALEASAIEAVMNSRFSPGTRNGKPVDDTMFLRVRFELDAQEA